MIRQLQRLSPRHRTWLSLLIWIIAAALLAVLLITFVARSYSVHGISMEPTLHSGDIVFTNKLERSWNNLIGKPTIPAPGQLVVFRNPFYNQGNPDMFIIKRVVGLPGDRIVVRDGRITVYDANAPTKGFNPDTTTQVQGPTSGTVDRIVPKDELFLVGDNRQGKNSLDSRNGMSTVPAKEIEGTVVLKFWPLNAFTWLAQ